MAAVETAEVGLVQKTADFAEALAAELEKTVVAVAECDTTSEAEGSAAVAA